MNGKKSEIKIRESREEDYKFVIDSMDVALRPRYGGDHRAHARRIFSTHVSGRKDNIGHFSFEQKMFILTINVTSTGMIHLAGKRQSAYKISPIIVAPKYRGKHGSGTMLLEFVEKYSKDHGARQKYCTVAEQNNGALQFFTRKGYIVADRSESHYQAGIIEVMLYKLFVSPDFKKKFDRPNISVLPCEKHHEPQVRQMLLDTLPRHFKGINSNWIEASFGGDRRHESLYINLKYKLIYVAVDRSNTALGVTSVTPKKGEPIKIMPLVVATLPAFVALITEIPNLLKPYGHKLYIHILPSVKETIALQQQGWKLDAAAYHDDLVTQQRSLDIGGEDFMKCFANTALFPE